MKQSSIYWLCSSVSELQRRRAALLEEVGYEVFFFQNHELLAREASVRRAQILIISDQSEAGIAEQAIHSLAHLPEIHGSRLILTNSSNIQDLMTRVMKLGFRDIIPDSIDDADWLRRFEFATSGLSAILEPKTPPNLPEETMELLIPARIVWVGPQHLWIESRLSPAIGDTVQLRGPLAQSLGLESLKLSVEQRQQSHLSFRFSEAVVAHWYRGAVEDAEPQKILDTLDELAKIDLGPRPRIFLAIYSPALRATLSRYLDPQRYEVHAASHPQSLLYEPKYFSPDLVFIEDRLLTTDGRKGFHDLLRFLPEHTMVVSVGSKEESSVEKNLGGGRRLRFLKNIPVHLGELIERDYLANLQQKKTPIFDPKKVHAIPQDHALSFAQLSVSARLQRADERLIEFSSQQILQNYSLLIAQCPYFEKTLNGPAFIKIVGSQDGQMHRALICNEFFHSQS